MRWNKFFIYCCIFFFITITSNATGAPFKINSNTKHDTKPAIAYNSYLDEFLVVWEYEAAGELGSRDIYGQRLSSAGSFIGGAFLIATDARHEENPQIAYNAGTQEYLVVYELTYSATDHDIYVQRVSGSGSLIGSRMVVAVTASYESNPAIVYNSQDNEFLVIYELRIGSGEFIQNDIYGQRRDVDGSDIGSTFAISSGSLDESNPALAYAGSTNRYLAVWQARQTDGAYDIHSRLVSATGYLYSKIIVATWADYDLIKPRVAFNSNSNEFLVVWEDHRWGWGNDWNVYGQRIGNAGSILGPANGFGIYWNSEKHSLNPDVVANPTANEFMVVWEFEYSATDHDVYQRRVGDDGTLLDDAVAISAGGSQESLPAVASNGFDVYFAAWEDGRDIGTQQLNIYGDLVNLPVLSGQVYEGNPGDYSTPLDGVDIDLYCALNATELGDWITGSYTENNGWYALVAARDCAYFNIIQHDLSNYYSTGASSTGGMVKEDNWIQYTSPLTGKTLSNNYFWDSENQLPPAGWRYFSPAGWVTDQTPGTSVQVRDTDNGLNVHSAYYSYTVNGSTFSSWIQGTCSGADGSTGFETITASSVPFNQDSGTGSLNRIRFAIADVFGLWGYSPVYTVNIDTTPPGNPTVINGDRATSTWSNDNSATMSWSGATDITSGINSYSHHWSTSSSAVPDAVADTTASSAATTIPGDGSNWHFHVRTLDNAGNWSSSSTASGPYYLDTTAPNNPTVINGDRPIYSWTNDNTATMSWSGAADANSGIYGYSIQWSTSASTIPDTVVDTTAGSANTTIPGSGSSWYFHVRARDNAGNWASGATHFGPFYLDTNLPQPPTSITSDHTVSVWSNNPVAVMSWSGAGDSTSYITGYSYQWSTSSSTLPDAAADTTGVSATTTIPADGSNWYFHVRSRDAAGNWSSSAAHSGPYRLDTILPLNPTMLTAGRPIESWSNNPVINMTWSGAVGGMAYSYVWSESADTVPDTTIETFHEYATVSIPNDGTGWYFHVRTVDAAGNWASGATHLGPFYLDTVPPQNPGTIICDRPKMEMSSDAIAQMSWSGASDNASGVAGYSYHWREPDGTTLIIPDQTMDTNDTSASTIIPGDGTRWYFSVRTVDQAGNWAALATHQGPYYLDITSRAYFYTPKEAVVFIHHTGTDVVIRNQYNNVVWSKNNLVSGDARVISDTELGSPGNFSITSNKRVSLLAGDMVTGVTPGTRGYYLLDSQNNPWGTRMYTHLKENTATDNPVLIVFSDDDYNWVKISRRSEFSYTTHWEGYIHKAGHKIYEIGYSGMYRITSSKPFSALVTGKNASSDPGSYSIPATNNSFSGREFYTYLPGGDLNLFSYYDNTTINIYRTDTGQTFTRQLDAEEFTTFTAGTGFYRITSNNSITACRVGASGTQFYRGMDYIAEASGALYGHEFLFKAVEPVRITAYEENTTVEEYDFNGQLQNTYNLNIGEFIDVFSTNAGKMVSNNTISLASIGNIGASFVPIPYENFASVPGSPAVFGVTHRPLEPTTNDSQVKVTWATDEPATSCLSYRVNNGAWMTGICDNQLKTSHRLYINLSSLSGNDVVDYYVWSTDKDSYTTYNTNGGKYFSFEVSPYIPDIQVSRLSVYPNADGDAFTVTLDVENVGTADAKNIKITERLRGFLVPTDQTTINLVNDTTYDVTIDVPDLAQYDSVIVSYEVVPILYATYDMYNIGSSSVSSVSFENDSGKTYLNNFSAPYSFYSADVLNMIRTKDYVIATNVPRLQAVCSGSNFSELLRKTARFTIERQAVVAELQSYNVTVVEKLINSNWNGRLNQHGYANGWKFLSILGKTCVVPAYDTKHGCTFDSDRHAPIADNVYADIKTGDDYVPELIVARFPGTATKHFIQQMDNGLTPLHLDKAVLVSGTGDGEDDFQDSVNEIDDFLTEYSTVSVTHWADLADTARLNDFKTDAVNADLIFYRDHGGKTSWDDTVTVGDLQPWDSGDIKFGTKNPIVWSIACWTGHIHVWSLADAFLDSGSANFIGATHKSPRSQNNDFARHLAVYWNNPYFGPSIGKTFKGAKWKLIHENISWYSTCYADMRAKQVVNMYNLYGDPKRGLPSKSDMSAASESAAGLGSVEDSPPQDYTSPPATIDIVIPAPVINTINGFDHVSIPVDESTKFSEHDEPIVPSYVHKEYITKEFKIQDIQLVSRTGLQTFTGLNLPVASFSDDSGEPYPSDPPADIFPAENQVLSWKVYEEMDGNQVLIITILPFHNFKTLNECRFYQNFSVKVTSIQTEISISDISTDDGEVDSGVVAVASLIVNNPTGAAAPVTVEFEVLDNAFQHLAVLSSTAVDLDPGDNLLTQSFDTAGYDPGLYYVQAMVKNPAGDILDVESCMIKIGILGAAAVEMIVTPFAEQGFEPGDQIEIISIFENTCTMEFTGQAVCRILTGDGTQMITEFVNDVSLTAGQRIEPSVIWDTTGIPEGEYRIVSFLVYDGKTTPPMTADVHTKQEVLFSVHTERTTFLQGDKIVAWAKADEDAGISLADSVVTAQIINPATSATVFSVIYYPEQDMHGGWYELPASSVDGIYKIVFAVDKPGYRKTEVEKYIYVGINPCPADFNVDGDVDGQDLFTQTEGQSGMSLGDFANEFGRICE